MSTAFEDKLSKIWNHIPKWSMCIPLNPVDNYRYNGHPTIYSSTSSDDGFNPSEREILIHRYLNRYLAGTYVRFYLSGVDRKFKEIRPTCWTYAVVLRVSHGNTSGVYGCINVDIAVANTMETDKITITPGVNVVMEVIPKAWFDELVKMVNLN